MDLEQNSLQNWYVWSICRIIEGLCVHVQGIKGLSNRKLYFKKKHLRFTNCDFMCTRL